MNDEEIARAWMASPHWGGWRVGMIRADGQVILEQSTAEYGQEVRLEGHGWVEAFDDKPPNLDHPGTLAFLLEDVRRAWGIRGRHRGWIQVTYEDAECSVLVADACEAFLYEGAAPAQPEALLAALQAAPEAK